MIKQKTKLNGTRAYVCPECEIVPVQNQGMMCQSPILTFGAIGLAGGDADVNDISGDF